MPPPRHALQIAALDADAPLTPAQKRFNTLIGQIERERSNLASWLDHVQRYREAHAAQALPLADELRRLQRQWTLALDALLEIGRWSSTDRETADLLLTESAGDLLRDAADDTVLADVFERHAGIDPASERRQRAQAMKQMAEEMTGFDLGADDDLHTEEELRQRLHERMREREGAAADAADAEAQAGHAPPRKPTAAAQRREREAADAIKSTREVYRQLASALHPDRETDPEQRDQKTALMQEVNRAYAADDLLALLELQLRIEHIDTTTLAAVPAPRLKHYNQVLAAQLAELRAEVERTEFGFRMEFGFGIEAELSPRRLGVMLHQQVQALRAELNERRRDLALFDDADATKRWLKRERRRMRYGLGGFDGGF